MDNIILTVVPPEGGEMISKMSVPKMEDYIANEVPIYETLLKNGAIKDYKIVATNDNMPVNLTVTSKREWGYMP